MSSSLSPLTGPVPLQGDLGIIQREDGTEGHDRRWGGGTKWEDMTEKQRRIAASKGRPYITSEGALVAETSRIQDEKEAQPGRWSGSTVATVSQPDKQKHAHWLAVRPISDLGV